MIPVYWLSGRGSWDMGIIEELTAGPEFVHREGADVTYPDGGGIFVLPGQHWVDQAQDVAMLIACLPWALTIVTSDEEALFPVEMLPRADNSQGRWELWGQYHARPEFDRVIPIGAPPRTGRDLAWARMEKGLLHYPDSNRDVDVMWAGQDTHERRHELLAVIKDMACEQKYGTISWLATTGFSQGLDRPEYLQALTRTRIAPCPSGPHSLDSFRLYEAIAAGTLPIVEASTPHGDEREFWDALFGDPDECPILMLEIWHDLPSIVERLSDPTEWRAQRDEVQDWYRHYRAGLTLDFKLTIERIRS